MNDAISSTHPAPLWRRLAAMVYDSVVVLALWMPVGYLVMTAFGVEGNINTDAEGMPYLSPMYSYAMFAAMMISAYLFFAWFWTHSGQTIGMQAWKIRIANTDGSSINYQQSLIRFLLGGLSLVFLGAGHWYMLFNKQKETLHDRVSHSVVVRVAR